MRKKSVSFLPELQGRPEEVIWANRVRGRRLTEVGILVSDARMSKAPAFEAMLAAENALKSITQAKWWVEHRGSTGATLLLLMQRENEGEAVNDAAKAN